jgi:hypothetical protein
MRYSDIANPQLNEGAVKDILVKIKNLLGKIKSIMAPLSKFNFKKFSSIYQSQIKPIADNIMQELLSGSQMSFDDVVAKLQPIAAKASTDKILGEGVELTEDVESIVSKMFAQLATVFLSFMAIIQSDYVLKNFNAANAAPSKMNDMMLNGSAFCLLYILTGIAMSIALTMHFKKQGKERDDNEDAALAKKGLTKHY